VIFNTDRRSESAVGLVRRAGFTEVIHVSHGGVSAWAEQGHPVENPAPTVTA